MFLAKLCWCANVFSMRVKWLSRVLGAVAVLAVGWPWLARAADPFLIVPPFEEVKNTPAYRYANMAPDKAIEELNRRGVLYQQVPGQAGVAAPIRLTGRLNGVHFHSSLAEHERPTTPFELCDARLALALDDFAALLRRHDIVEVVHFTMYRPAAGVSSDTVYGENSMVHDEKGLAVGQPFGVAAFARGQWSKTARSKMVGSKANKSKTTPAKGATGGKVRGKKSVKGQKKGDQSSPGATKTPPIKFGPSRHSMGLAIDVGTLVGRDGTIYSIQSHFGGKIGSRTCGKGARVPSDERGRLLWKIVCESYDQKLFTYVLTPNYDASHNDHLHMEINPVVQWFLYH